jgi:hypothetical protein
LSFVADSAGLTQSVTHESQIPQWYLDYCNKLLQGEPKSSGAVDRLIGTEVRDDNSSNCTTFGSTWLYPGVAVMYPILTVWSNRIARVTHIDLYGSTSLYNKWFFKGYLGTVNSPGLQRVDLCGTVAYRRTSSLIRVAI